MPAYVGIGEILIREGKTKQAVEILKKVYAKTRSNIILHRLEELFLEQGEPSEIIRVYQEALRQDPNNPALQFYLGKLYYRLEMVDEAFDILSTVEGVQDQLADYHKIMANLYLRKHADGTGRHRTEEGPAFQKTRGRPLCLYRLPARIDRMVWALPKLWDLEYVGRIALAERRWSSGSRCRQQPPPSLSGSLPRHCFSLRNRVGFRPARLPDTRSHLHRSQYNPLQMMECPMVDYQDYAAKALRDETLTRDECQAVLDTPDEQLLGLLQAAFTVRSRYFGKTVRLQMLQNAKSGACQEDCHYCSQSAISTAPIERYNLVPQQQMIDGARQAAASKAQRYCIVISGRSPLDREIDEIAGAVRSIKQEIPIQICCSLGLMNEQQAKRLKAAGVDRVNHNLNTSEAFHSSICTTHTFQDRLSTIRNARAAGLEICSGGIVGMGEKDEDLIDLAMALRRCEAGLDSTEHAPSGNRHAAREL